MLESYITPLLMSYVDKYIKNLKPSDLSLSLWGGDVVLYNLELRLDVLEKVRGILNQCLKILEKTMTFCSQQLIIKIIIIILLDYSPLDNNIISDTIPLLKTSHYFLFMIIMHKHRELVCYLRRMAEMSSALAFINNCPN